MRNATRITTATFGSIAGLAGIEHGIGEILQGNRAPEGVMFSSWAGSESFRMLNGEPAMSIIPNLLVSGILTVLFSLIFIAWAVLFAQKKNGGSILILMSIILLLVGGGFGPPLLGIIIGMAANKINSPLVWWRTHLPVSLRKFLGKSWPWIFTLCIISWLAMMPGTILLTYFFGVNDPNIVLTLLVLTFGSLFLTIITGFGNDSLRENNNQLT